MVWNVLTALLLFFTVTAVSPNLPAQDPRDESVQVQLHLAVSSAAMRVGGRPILVRLELRNKGNSDFFAASNLVAITSAPAYMIVYAENQNGKRVPLEQMDAIMSSEAMNDDWTRISPGHFYGIEFPLKTSSYQAIDSPGTYTISAEYISTGGLTPPSPDWSVPSHKVWKGKLVSNSVSIQVLSGAELPPRRK